MSYSRPTFQVDRTMHTQTRQNFGTMSLSISTGGGQVLLHPTNPTNQSDIYSQVPIHLRSKDLDTILRKYQSKKKPSSSSSSMQPWDRPNTLARPEIASRRQQRQKNALFRAQEKWMKRALFRGRRFGFTKAETVEEIETFSDFCQPNKEPATTGTQDLQQQKYSQTDGELNLCKFLGQATELGVAKAENKAQTIALTAQTQMDLDQLATALGELYYPELLPSIISDDNPEDQEDASAVDRRKHLLMDIAMFLLHRHSDTGFVDVVQWMSIVSSGDIDTALNEVQKHRDQVFSVGRKGGCYRPPKGHRRSKSAAIRSHVAAIQTRPKHIRVRAAKQALVSMSNQQKVKRYIEQRGIRLGMQRSSIEQAKQEAVAGVEQRSSLPASVMMMRSTSAGNRDRRGRNRKGSGGEESSSMKEGASLGGPPRMTVTGNNGSQEITQLQQQLQQRPQQPPRTGRRAQSASSSSRRRSQRASKSSPVSRHRKLVKSSRPKSSNPGLRNTNKIQQEKNEGAVGSEQNIRSKDASNVHTSSVTSAAENNGQHHNLNFYTDDHFFDLTESHHKKV